MSTAGEFLTAFYRDMPLSPSASGIQLHAMERAVLHVVPSAVAFAQSVAEGRLCGAQLRDECRAVVQAVEDLESKAGCFSRGLFLARITVGLPARTFDPLAFGQSATVALIYLAKRVVAASYSALEKIAAEWGSLGCAEDDDPVLDADVLDRPSVAAALSESLAALSFPSPSSLLHEMAAELMLLDAAKVQAADLTGRLTPDDFDDLGLGRLHGDDAPSIPQRTAAKRTKKSKEEDNPDPMPPEKPHPVDVKNVDEIVRKFAELLARTPPLDGGRPSSKTPIIYSLGDSAYRVGDGKPVSVKENEDAVLQAFVGMPVMNSSVLKSRSSNNDAPLVLNRLRKRYEEAFASAIQCPGTPGKGGYTARVEIATQHIP